MPDSGKRYVLRGESGKSVFTRPFGPDGQLLAQWDELSELMGKAYKARDERSYAIVVALVMENRLERLMHIWLPGFKKISESRDYTTSMKSEFLKASNLVPNHIIESADAVRGIRNNFAHDLGHDSFDDLKQKTKSRLEGTFLKIFGGNKSGKPSVKEQFAAVGFVATRGLHEYARNLDMLARLMKRDGFEEAIEASQDVGPKAGDPMQLRARVLGPDEPMVEISTSLLVETYEGRPGSLIVHPLDAGAQKRRSDEDEVT